ncbi:MAG: thioredoxin, partial [Rhodospirillaceae bacterium]
IGEIMETIIDPSNSASPSTGELIKDSSDAEFVTDVIEGSKQVPVIVDFWAPWCGPCKQLGPTLEKVISEAGGAVKLVKIDIDQNPQVAQQLRIQSIPAVYAFYQGRPVDGFQGALPESQLKDFVKKLTDAAGSTQTSPIDEALAQAKALVEAGEKTQAEMLYEQVLQHDPDNSEAAINLARLSMESGESERTRNLIEGLSDEAKKSPEATSVISALALAEKAGDGGNLASLKAASEANPSDHQARLDLAVALFGLGKREAGIDELLEIIRRDRKWKDDAARIQLLEFFEALGPTDELTVQGRKRLSSILFS